MSILFLRRFHWDILGRIQRTLVEATQFFLVVVIVGEEPSRLAILAKHPSAHPRHLLIHSLGICSLSTKLDLLIIMAGLLRSLVTHKHLEFFVTDLSTNSIEGLRVVHVLMIFRESTFRMVDDIVPSKGAVGELVNITSVKVGSNVQHLFRYLFLFKIIANYK